MSPTVFGYCVATPGLSAYEPPNVPARKTGLLGGLMALSPALGALSGVIVTLPALGGPDQRLGAVALMVVACVLPVLFFGKGREAEACRP